MIMRVFVVFLYAKLSMSRIFFDVSYVCKYIYSTLFTKHNGSTQMQLQKLLLFSFCVEGNNLWWIVVSILCHLHKRKKTLAMHHVVSKSICRQAVSLSFLCF